MTFDHFHDKYISKHGDTKKYIIFMGLKLGATMKIRKKMIWRQPKKLN
jgi:hypothetical protein